MSKQVTVEVSEDAVRKFGGNEARFGREMYETAVVQWFAEGRLSQGQAAELLGLKRGEFFDLLYERKVSPVQMSLEDLEEDFRCG